MNSFTAAWRKLTYRTERTNPDPAAGLVAVAGRCGARTVYDPRVPDYLQARRERLLRDGLDLVDMALLDPDTLTLLAATAARMDDAVGSGSLLATAMTSAPRTVASTSMAGGR